jgi:hypothetical protein
MRSILPSSESSRFRTFISEFRKTLRSDDELLQSYSYTEKETRTEIDRDGKPKSTEVNIYQISPDRGRSYRRLISRNGVPLTQNELDKQDRDEQMKPPASPRDDTKIRDELFEIYNVQVEGRETVEGSPAVVLSFRPQADYKPQSKLASFLMHVSGRAWGKRSRSSTCAGRSRSFRFRFLRMVSRKLAGRNAVDRRTAQGR